MPTARRKVPGYWTRINNSWVYEGLSFFFGYQPKFLGQKTSEGTYYQVFESPTKNYLRDKQLGRIFEREIQ